jgi:hypothetical protein
MLNKSSLIEGFARYATRMKRKTSFTSLLLVTSQPSILHNEIKDRNLNFEKLSEINECIWLMSNKDEIIDYKL